MQEEPSANRLTLITAYVEPSLAVAQTDHKVQFERFGYFVADRVDRVAGSKPSFNRAMRLQDFWGK